MTVRTVSEGEGHLLNHFTSKHTGEIKTVTVNKHNSFGFTHISSSFNCDINKTMDVIRLQWVALLSNALPFNMTQEHMISSDKG